MVPVFTTTHPGFMGFGERNEDFIQKMEQPETRKMVGFPEGHFQKTYFHGKLEDWLGFDIVVWLSGEIHNVRTQKCEVWNTEGTEKVEAVMTTTERGTLITFPDEPEEFRG